MVRHKPVVEEELEQALVHEPSHLQAKMLAQKAPPPQWSRVPEGLRLTSRLLVLTLSMVLVLPVSRDLLAQRLLAESLEPKKWPDGAVPTRPKRGDDGHWLEPQPRLLEDGSSPLPLLAQLLLPLTSLGAHEPYWERVVVVVTVIVALAPLIDQTLWLIAHVADLRRCA